MPDTPHAATSTANPADVLIVGAGPAGLALATALADAGFTAQVLEQQPLAAIEAPAEDGREIALTHRARAVMQRLGLWERLAADDISPLREARVLDGNASAFLRFGTPASSAEPLGWLVPNHQIRRVALAAARARPGVSLITDARVAALSLDGPLGQVTLADGRRFAAPLVVAADSRLSETRRRAGIGASMRDFGRSVVTGRIAHERSNDGIAWECFRYGNTLALLPMNGRRVSAVVTVASDRAADWAGLDDDAFAARIQQQSGGRLGTLRAEGPRHLYPLVGVVAQRFVAPRFALIGDAAVGMHPVTAHGYNFGLYGVEVLVQELATARRAGRDVGDLAALQRYEAEHRRTTLPIYHGTNAVVSLFTDERLPAKLVRRAVLTVAERVPPFNGLVHAAITRQLTGLGGPAWAGRPG